MVWFPHVTVASVIKADDKFLMVKETNENGEAVYNQPAGHVEENESLIEAMIREVLEETRWQVKPLAVLSLRMYKSPANNITYLRTNFIAEAILHNENLRLDDDIDEVCWLSAEEIKTKNLRSPLVWQAIEEYESGLRYPLEILDNNTQLSR
ncbi:NUDIX hydrolase [Aurantivibrio infirmus]